MWDRRVVEKVEEAVGHFSVSCKFKNVGDQFEWAFTGIYGPNLNKRRRLMWEELTGLISWWDLPWCLGGEFNKIYFSSEGLGAASYSRAMYGFSDFISLHGLMDIPMRGGPLHLVQYILNFSTRSVPFLPALGRSLHTVYTKKDV